MQQPTIPKTPNHMCLFFLSPYKLWERRDIKGRVGPLILKLQPVYGLVSLVFDIECR